MGSRSLQVGGSALAEAAGLVVEKARAVILRMEGVPAMDATGLVALESALAMLRKRGCLVVITGLQEQPRRLLANAGIIDKPGEVLLRRDLNTALQELTTA